MSIFFSFSAAASHPNLLFSDIHEVPGYQCCSASPWKNWEASIIRSADNSLSRDFSDPKWATHNRISYRSEFASDLGLAYQITKQQKYFDKGRQALLNLDVGDVPYNMDRSTALRGYALAYDWIQPGLTSTDDKVIRDKLARLADQTYRDLNSDGTKTNYISFADYHGQAYPCVAIAGLALEDYTNPNGISLSSGPEDWTRAGTDYLFANDKLHTFNRPLISYGFDEESGKHLLGSYKSYVIDDLLWWFQVYSVHYDRNILEDYPAAKNIVTSELWETLPNGYMNNYVTSGNTLETYHNAIISLLNKQEKGEVLRYLDQTEGNNLLPYSRENDLAPIKILYCTYENYDSIIPESPEWTSHLDEEAIYQVFRGDWEEDSDWLSLITFDVQTNSNRDMAHHDQLSIEYYSRGDLLLADAGETKHVLDAYYGQYGVHHNSIEIEDPRRPFAQSSWADSQARGVYKGDAAGIITPAKVEAVVQTPWVEGIVASETITAVIDDHWSTQKTLTSPIEYTRTILHPDDEYFIIYDSLKSDTDWTYRNVFRLSSLSILPTNDKNGDRNYAESEIGHVKGTLTLNENSFDWLSLPYKKETKTGITTNSVNWITTNPNNKQVQLNIYSVPTSEIIITKHVGRVAGYDAESEVFTPILYLRNGPEEKLNRITVLISGYLNEKEKTTEEIPVTGNGNAVKVTSPTNTDTIYSGEEASSFDGFHTDAGMIFFRQPKNSPDYYCLMSGGTYLRMGGDTLINVSKTDSGMKITVNIPKNTIEKIIRDGTPFTEFEATEDGSAIELFSDTTYSAFEIHSNEQTAHIIISNKIDSASPYGIKNTPDSKSRNEPSEQEAGIFTRIPISGTILFMLICYFARRE